MSKRLTRFFQSLCGDVDYRSFDDVYFDARNDNQYFGQYDYSDEPRYGHIDETPHTYRDDSRNDPHYDTQYDQRHDSHLNDDSSAVDELEGEHDELEGEEEQTDLIDQSLYLIKQGLSIFDSELRLVKCNRRFVTMYELPEELSQPGTSFEDINLFLAYRGDFGPGDPLELVKTRVELAKRFEPHYMERTRPNGQRYAIEGHPLRKGGWVAIYSNITEEWKQKQLLLARSDTLSDKLLMHNEQQAQVNRELAAANRALTDAKANLQASEERIRTITNSLPAHIAYVDRNYTYLFSNNRLDDVMNLRASNVLGKHMSEVFSEDTYAILRRNIDKAFTGQIVSFEYDVANTHETKAQSIRTTLSPEFGPDGNVVGVFVLSVNTSAEKAAIEMQLHAKRMETTAQLTSGLAHDFSNILTIILGNLHRMSKGATALQLDLMRTTERAARRGTRIIDNLMSLLYRHQLDDKEANINHVLKDLVPLFSSLNSDIQLNLHLPEEDIFASVDEGAIQDVVLNILFNSKDAIESASGRGVISLFASIVTDNSQNANKELLQIKVSDSGEGFSEQALSLASEPFFSTKPQGAGTGLGLSMVRSIAEQLGGSLELENSIDAGAIVTFTVPRNPTPNNDAVTSDVAATQINPVTEQAIALIVDDNPDIRTLVRHHVTQKAIPVVEASNVDDAIALIEQLEQISLVVSDIVMPGERTGLDLAQYLKKNKPDTTVLLVSGLPPESELMIKAKAQFTVLHKPLEPKQLDSHLSQWNSSVPTSTLPEKSI